MYRILLLVLFSFTVANENDGKYPPVLTTTDFIQRHGYPNQTHVVTTSDGYVLQMHRIPFGKNHHVSHPRRGVAFLMHGFECSSADWVVAGPEIALAFVLADAGFDVWMGNARGNKYSRMHVKLNPDSSDAFWDFSWHEIGVIDLPTMIDYVLQVTYEKQLMYVGHSQGTTTFFVMASERPEYNQKIKIMHAFAPVVFLDHVPVILKLITPFMESIQHMLQFFYHGEFIYSDEIMSLFTSFVCKDGSITQGFCSDAISLISGYDPSNFNKTLLKEMMYNFPAGASAKQLAHYGQVISTGKFAQYDHGELGNLVKYGTMHPPNYNLKRVTAKVALYVGPNDKMNDGPKNMEKLDKILPNVVEHYLVPLDDFTHSDFLYAIHIRELLYGKLFEMIDKYT